MNRMLLLLIPFTMTVTCTAPARPDGTIAVIELSLQLETVAIAPLNETEFVPCVSPKFDPVTVTVVPIPPFDGEMPAMA